MKRLKKIRVFISVCFFLLTTTLFVDVAGMLPVWTTTFEKLQFMPSVLSCSIGIVAFWLVFSFLFGRAYCSSVCPMGTFQDIFARIGKLTRSKKNARYRYSPAKDMLRYTVLLAVAACICSGIAALPALLDPYSAYGRMVAAFLQPLWNWAFDDLAESSSRFFTTGILLPGIIGTAVSATTFIVIGWLAFRNGRTFCNTVCPVGATLGICSRNAIWHIEIDTDKCIGCHRCESACKAACIDLREHTADMSRCVLCFNCISVCRDDAIAYTPFRKRPATPLMQRIREKLSGRVTTPAIDTMNEASKTAHGNRRKFFGTVGVAMVAGITTYAQKKAERFAIPAGDGHPVPVNRLKAITPPGTRSREDFLSRCTACQLCVSKCPQRVLRPSATEYGIFNALQPMLDYSESFCRYNCNLCTSVCPADALAYLPVTDKQKTPIGKAHFLLRNCITQRDGVSCGSCAKKCPANAIELVDYNSSEIPQINETACIGCGKCEYVCPASPKAIYVEGI